MKTNNYFFKTVLLGFCLTLSVAPAAQAMQQLKTYEQAKKNRRRARCCILLALSAGLTSIATHIHSSNTMQSTKDIFKQNYEIAVEQQRNCLADVRQNLPIRHEKLSQELDRSMHAFYSSNHCTTGLFAKFHNITTFLGTYCHQLVTRSEAMSRSYSAMQFEDSIKYHKDMKACDEFGAQTDRAHEERFDFMDTMPSDESTKNRQLLSIAIPFSGLLGLMAYDNYSATESATLEEMCDCLEQQPHLIAELNQEQRKTVFERAVKNNNRTLMTLVLPHIQNSYMFLNAMLTIAKGHKHNAAIKFIVDEIRKQVKPKIDAEIYATGTNLPPGIPELITDYIEYVEPVKAQPQADHEHQD